MGQILKSADSSLQSSQPIVQQVLYHIQEAVYLIQSPLFLLHHVGATMWRRKMLPHIEIRYSSKIGIGPVNGHKMGIRWAFGINGIAIIILEWMKK
jgi:hypothetical protein